MIPMDINDAVSKASQLLNDGESIKDLILEINHDSDRLNAWVHESCQAFLESDFYWLIERKNILDITGDINLQDLSAAKNMIEEATKIYVNMHYSDLACLHYFEEETQIYSIYCEVRGQGGPYFCGFNINPSKDSMIKDIACIAVCSESNKIDSQTMSWLLSSLQSCNI